MTPEYSPRRRGHPAGAARAPFLGLLALAAVFIGSVAFVGLRGNFPLDDDWSYAITTRTLAATHSWMPTGWTSMPLISQALWAMPICAASTCGFADLRLSTLLASLLLFSVTFMLARRHSRIAVAPVVAALLVAFNPIGYTLSFTFMTDVLFAALMTTGALLFVASLERDSAGLAVLATLVAVAATMSRQIGLCIPLGYLVVRLLQAGDWRRKAVMAVAPLALCAACLVLFNHWLRISGRLPAAYYFYSNVVWATMKLPVAHQLLSVGRNVITLLLYLGLFCLPMLLLTRRASLLARPYSRLRMLPSVAACGAVVLAVIDMIDAGKIMPVSGDILVSQGFGALTLRDVAILGLPNLPPLPSGFWMGVTLLSIGGTYELTARGAIYAVNTVSACRFGRLAPDDYGALFVVMAVLAYCVPFMLIDGFVVDRYYFPILPLILFLLASVAPAEPVGRYRVLAGAAVCLLTGLYSVLGEHDYMAWNRARWAAITDLQAAGTAGPANLDGGFEYNGYYDYRPVYQSTEGKSWWWVNGDDYQITFGPIDGCGVIKTYPYQALLPPAKRSVLVLKCH